MWCLWWVCDGSVRCQDKAKQRTHLLILGENCHSKKRKREKCLLMFDVVVLLLCCCFYDTTSCFSCCVLKLCLLSCSIVAFHCQFFFVCCRNSHWLVRRQQWWERCFWFYDGVMWWLPRHQQNKTDGIGRRTVNNANRTTDTKQTAQNTAEQTKLVNREWPFTEQFQTNQLGCPKWHSLRKGLHVHHYGCN